MEDSKLSRLTEEWFDLNNKISSEETFDLAMYQKLSSETMQIFIKSVKKESTAQLSSSKRSFSAEEVRLLLEISAFVYKEIYTDEQLNASNQMYDFLQMVVSSTGKVNIVIKL